MNNFYKDNLFAETPASNHIENIVERNFIKSGVNRVFEEHPGLVGIGSQEQYSSYLENIFSDSQIKEILYHEGNEGIIDFDNTKYNKHLGREELKFRYGLGHYFAGDIEYAEGFGEQMYSVMLDMKSPKLITIDGSSENYRKIANIDQAALDQLRRDGYDSVVGIAVEELKEAYPDEYVVFEPEQAHILGSQKDIDAFRKFVDNE
ncbi:MAG: hypothetical protein ACOYMB_01585 [Patescibacteria group bacterium]